MPSGPKARIWTIEEKQFILDNWDRMTKIELAQKLKCSVSTLNKKGRELGLSMKQINIPYQPSIKHPKGELLHALGFSFNPWGM